jgi:regulator of cell morphogenesis and NO signaling
MTFNTTTTVRELAVEMPHATRIMEKLKIDYCCGGHRPFTEACTDAGLDADEVLREIAESFQSGSDGQMETASFQTWSLHKLTGYIVETHHVFTRQELDRLTALISKVCAAHGRNHPEVLMISTLFRALRGELVPHMNKEEQVLFPYIDRLEADGPVGPPPFGSVSNPVRMLMAEHDVAGEILAKVRTISNGFTVPPDTCISYQTLYQALEALEQDLHQHIHLENNILFPRAIELAEAIQLQLATEITETPETKHH